MTSEPRACPVQVSRNLAHGTLRITMVDFSEYRRVLVSYRFGREQIIGPNLRHAQSDLSHKGAVQATKPRAAKSVNQRAVELHIYVHNLDELRFRSQLIHVQNRAACRIRHQAVLGKGPYDLTFQVGSGSVEVADVFQAKFRDPGRLMRAAAQQPLVNKALHRRLGSRPGYGVLGSQLQLSYTSPTRESTSQDTLA